MERQTKLFSGEKLEAYTPTKSALIPASGGRISWAFMKKPKNQLPQENPTNLLKEIIEHQDDAVCDTRNWKADGPTDAAILDRYEKAGIGKDDYPNVSGSRLFGLILPELKKARVPDEAVLGAFQKALLNMKRHIQSVEKCMDTSLSCYYTDDNKTLWLGHFKSEYKTYLATCKFARCQPKTLRQCHLTAIDNAIAVLKDKPKWLQNSTTFAKTEKQKAAAAEKRQKEIVAINLNLERIEKIREVLACRIGAGKNNQDADVKSAPRRRNAEKK
ncbi:MAG: hypothetical protein WC976_06670 [Caldisericia bacterium]